MDSIPEERRPSIPRRKPVPTTAPRQPNIAPQPIQQRELKSQIIPNAFLAFTILAATYFSWPVRWIISGAPILVYAILLGEAYNHRIFPFVPLWSIFATINLVYAVSATSWLLYWTFWATCWPALLITCLFQFEAPGGLARRLLRKTFLRSLHFTNDQVAFFDLPALEIDTEVKGLFAIRGVTLSLSTMTLVAHGVQCGIKIADDIELSIQTDEVTVPLFREITVDDLYANVKGGDWEVNFKDVAFGKPEPEGDDFIATDTALLRAASVAQKKGIKHRPTQMVNEMTGGASPALAGDTKSAFSSVRKVSPDEQDALAEYQTMVQNIHDTSSITHARNFLKNAAEALKESSDEDSDPKKKKTQSTNTLDATKDDDMRAAICAQIHSHPSIPHPPTTSIRLSTLKKTSYPEVKKFLHRLPFLYRLMLSPICYFHNVKFKSITAAGSGKWFVSLMRQYLFKHYGTSDSEIRRLEARISAWCSDANFAVEFGPIQSHASFPLSTNYDIKCNFQMSDVMAYRTVPDTVEVQQVVRLGGADAVLTIPTFLFPHHEHIFPKMLSEFELMEMEQLIKDTEIDGTPKGVQARKDLKKYKKDEAAMSINAHVHLPAQFHQDLLNFIAAIVKATKVIESDRDFEEAQDKVMRELKRVSTSDSEASSITSGNTTTTTNTGMSQIGSSGDDKSFKTFLRKVDSGFKEAGAKTMVGMRKAGHNTVTAMANDRWIARLVGKVTKKLENAQGEVGYSGEVPIELAKYRSRHEEGSKILP